MTIAQLLVINWQKKFFPRKWLRSLYRSHILNAPISYSLPFECYFYGMRYRGDISNVIDFHCFFYGAFEKGHLLFWKDVAQLFYHNKGVFIDIGANSGHHTLFMSARSAAVHSFEPYEPVRNKIFEKIEINNLKNIFVHDVGVGNTNELIPFFAPEGSNLGIGSFVAGQKNRNDIGIPLRVVAGDEYFNRYISDEIHMIKIDVEAYEKQVIKGLHGTIQQFRPVMVFELEIGLDCSFKSFEEIQTVFPKNYMFFTFDIWDKHGNKNKRKDGIFRKKGTYKLKFFNFDMTKEQTDVIAFPGERFDKFRINFPDKIAA